MTEPGASEPSMAFTEQHVRDRLLVLRMLRAEDALHHSPYGQDVYRNVWNESLTSLLPQLTLQRRVLDQFGFDTDDSSVQTYRSIFAHYYRSPKDFDAEVMQSVVYMRENLLLYFTAPKPVVGHVISNCALHALNGTGRTTLHQELHSVPDTRWTMLCAFSAS